MYITGREVILYSAYLSLKEGITMGLTGVLFCFIGFALVAIGSNRLYKIDDKSLAVIMFIAGGLSLIMNIVSMAYGIVTHQSSIWFYNSATGLMFAFTYIIIGCNTVWHLDGRLLGLYALWVACNTIPAGILCFFNLGGDALFGIFWFIWGLLWLTMFIENNLHIDLGKPCAWAAILVGLITVWLPAWLMLMHDWMPFSIHLLS